MTPSVSARSYALLLKAALAVPLRIVVARIFAAVFEIPCLFRRTRPWPAQVEQGVA